MWQEGQADAGRMPFGPGMSSAEEGEKGRMVYLGDRGGLPMEETMDSGPELESGSIAGSEVPPGLRRSHPNSHMRTPSAVWGVDFLGRSH